MARPLTSLVGRKFGALTVLSFDRKDRRKTYWRCSCDCGTVKVFRCDHIKRGTATCGCFRFGQRARAENECPIGQEFGRLTVIAFGGYQNKNGRGRLTWVCRCECGTERSFEAPHVKNGKARSCGCEGRDILRERVKGKPSCARKTFGYSSVSVLRCSYRQRARRFGRVFMLTREEFQLLVFGNCHYCGATPSNRFEQDKLYGHIVYNGIDRVDNERGYVVDNCVSCCALCNRAKGVMSRAEFVALAHQIARRHPTTAPAATLATAGAAMVA